MKHIIIEGGDRLGKSTLIEGLVNHFNYDNVTIRHFGKPPKELPANHTALSYQTECFYKEGDLLQRIEQMENDGFCYYENIVIWNRAHLGEYVYGQMFRNTYPEKIMNMIHNFEERFLLSNPETYLILMTADPVFFFSKEDGNSLSKSIAQKTTELRLFKEAFDASYIDNKLVIKVNNGNEFVDKKEILNKALEFIKTQIIK